MLLKRGCPPMSHIWGDKAHNQTASIGTVIGLSLNKTIIQTERWTHGGRFKKESKTEKRKHPTGRLCSLAAYLYCHIAFSHLPHVETHRGNHVFTELARLHGTKGSVLVITAKSNWNMKCYGHKYPHISFHQLLFVQQHSVQIVQVALGLCGSFALRGHKWNQFDSINHF